MSLEEGLHIAKLHKEKSEGSVVGQVLHDVVFLILDEIRNVESQVKAHKLRVSQTSETFQALFLFLFAELNKQEKGVTQAGVHTLQGKIYSWNIVDDSKENFSF